MIENTSLLHVQSVNIAVQYGTRTTIYKPLEYKAQNFI